MLSLNLPTKSDTYFDFWELPADILGDKSEESESQIIL